MDIKKLILFFIITLEVLVIAKLLPATLTGNYLFQEPRAVVPLAKNNSQRSDSHNCESDLKTLKGYIKKLDNETFFNHKFPDSITSYEENGIKNLWPGTHTKSYYNDSGSLISVDVTINSEGFRGKEYNVTKPKNTKRIIAVGDSHTYGYRVKDNKTFPFQLEEKLNANSKETSWQVLNLGVPGHNLIQKLKMFKRKGLKYNPDIVILQLNQDDIYTNEIRSYVGKAVKEVGHRDIKVNCKIEDEVWHLFSKFEENFGEERLKSSMIEKPLRDFKKLQEKHNFSLILLVTWKKTETIKEFGRENNYPVREIHSDIFHNKDYSLSKYQGHFNSTGHRLIADYLYNLISNRSPNLT